jgi:hypothetical protein
VSFRLTAAANGASCGFEGITRGDQLGVLLQRVDNEWTSGLCSQVAANELRGAGEARPPSAAPRAIAVAGDVTPSGDDGPPWVLIAGGAVALALVVGGGIGVERRKRRRAT